VRLLALRPFTLTIALAASVLLLDTPGHAQVAAAPIEDREFWRLVTELSESSGRFPQQLMSNEDSAQFVMPELAGRVTAGGIYLGVGAEQNFTYIAAVKPRLAFVVDIRRENMLEMLMYQAVFELSNDRADFVSHLFSRKRPAALAATSTVDELFAAFDGVAADAALLQQNSDAVTGILTRTHRWPLPSEDQATITRMLGTFSAAGPQGLKGFGDMDSRSYAQLMAAADLTGRQQGFLVSETAYRTVRDLERQNHVVPIVGDFGGEKALASVARYLTEQRAPVSVFYVSNVERYLFDPGGKFRQFYANVAAMPLDRSAVFVRSVTRDISGRLGIALPDRPTRWWTFVAPIQDCLDGVASGRVKAYPDLFAPQRSSKSLTPR